MSNDTTTKTPEPKVGPQRRVMPPEGPKLCDRADGVKGRFCIGRRIEDGPFWEYWNDRLGKWWPVGTLYYGEEAALAKLDALAA